MLNSKRLGITGGIFWGISMFVLTLANVWFGYAPSFLALVADIYPGYEVSYFGSLIGLVYGFVDGFVGLYIFAWIYNKVGD